MTLFEFAWKNISRDRRNYVYFFVNCVFSVFVFFLFSVLSFHPALQVIDDHSAMGMTLAAGEAISVVFSIFFISYSMGCFLKARSRQLGVIAILGASKKQLNRLVFLENMLVGVLSILTGILLGLVFSKLFLDVANVLIGMSDFTFYFPIKAILLTALIMGMVFLGIAYFTPKFIRKKEVIKLLKAEAKDDKPQKLVPALAFFLLLEPVLLWAFFGKTPAARAMQESIFLPFLLMIAAALGTYLLFSLCDAHEIIIAGCYIGIRSMMGIGKDFKMGSRFIPNENHSDRALGLVCNIELNHPMVVLRKCRFEAFPVLSIQFCVDLLKLCKSLFKRNGFCAAAFKDFRIIRTAMRKLLPRQMRMAVEEGACEIKLQDIPAQASDTSCPEASRRAGTAVHPEHTGQLP